MTVVYGDAKNCGLSVAEKDTPHTSSEFLWKKVAFWVSYLLFWNETASIWDLRRTQPSGHSWNWKWSRAADVTRDVFPLVRSANVVCVVMKLSSFPRSVWLVIRLRCRCVWADGESCVKSAVMFVPHRGCDRCAAEWVSDRIRCLSYLPGRGASMIRKVDRLKRGLAIALRLLWP